jgi:hypothetical protein
MRMSEENQVHSGKADAHLDGEFEGVISSPTGINNVGIYMGRKSSHPFHVTSLRKDPEMERFSRFVDGK